MSNPQYINYEPAGQTISDNFHYSQAVIIGDVVNCAGQGGWDNIGKLDPNDLKGQIDLAFDHVYRALQAVGLRGWEDVYSVRSYHLDIAAGSALVSEKFKQLIPGHRPIWTCIGITGLADPGMLVEIEVEAYRGKN